MAVATATAPTANAPHNSRATGILRGPFELAVDHAMPSGITQNVAFIDPPANRSHRPPPSRSTTPAVKDAEFEGSPSPQQPEEPLVFVKRPTLASGRSSFSCSSCGRSAPISPVSDDTRTPSLSRSDTDLSDGAGLSTTNTMSHSSESQCLHHSVNSGDREVYDCPHMDQQQQSHQPQQHISLLTAALLASQDASWNKGNYSTTASPSSCGILKRDPNHRVTPSMAALMAAAAGASGQVRPIQPTGAAATAADHQKDHPQQATAAPGPGSRPAVKTHFVEPPKPSRSPSRRASLPPPSRKTTIKIVADPDHCSEGPESPTRSAVGGGGAGTTGNQISSGSGSPVNSRTAKVRAESNTAQSGNEPSAPVRKSALKFQDADEVKQRQVNREQQAVPNVDHVQDGQQHVRHAFAQGRSPAPGPSRLSGQQTAPVLKSSAVRLHPSDAIYLHSSRRPSPFSERIGPVTTDAPAVSASHHEHNAKTGSPTVKIDKAAERKLKFAASPHEVRLARRPSQRKKLLRTSRSPSSSEEEGPYVDSVAVHGSALSARGRLSSSSLNRASRGEPSSRPKRRSGSPAPRNLGGSEVGDKGAGQGRARSPAPRGKVLIPDTCGSAESRSVIDEDELDYDEDDEDDDEDDEDEDTESDDDGALEQSGDRDEDDDEEDEQVERRSRRKHRGAVPSPPASANFASRSRPTSHERAVKSAQASPTTRTRPTSPHPSVDSQSHPTAFSNSDFEEEGENVDRALDQEAQARQELHLSYNARLSPRLTDVDMAGPSRSREDPTFSSLSNSPLLFARQKLPLSAVSDGEACSPGPRRTFRFGGRPAQGSRSPGFGHFEPQSKAHIRYARPTGSPVRSRSSGVIVNQTSHQDKGTMPGILSPPQQHPHQPRSLSSSAIQRCAPSLAASAEAARAHIEPAVSNPAQQTQTDHHHHHQHRSHDGNSRAMSPSSTPHSPDAFTALRSCLETAFADDDHHHLHHDSHGLYGDGLDSSTRRPGYGHQHDYHRSQHQLEPVRRPWFTAFSTPGMLSPTGNGTFDLNRISSASPGQRASGDDGESRRSHLTSSSNLLGLGSPVDIAEDSDGRGHHF
ncbi:unnamed protein product [Sympodiomycopsis kandeliae]